MWVGGSVGGAGGELRRRPICSYSRRGCLCRHSFFLVYLLCRLSVLLQHDDELTTQAILFEVLFGHVRIRNAYEYGIMYSTKMTPTLSPTRRPASNAGTRAS